MHTHKCMYVCMYIYIYIYIYVCMMSLKMQCYSCKFNANNVQRRSFKITLL